MTILLGQLGHALRRIDMTVNDNPSWPARLYFTTYCHTKYRHNLQATQLEGSLLDHPNTIE